MEELQEYLDFAHRLADTAGSVLRRYYRQPVSVHLKADASPVSKADKEAEILMRELIETTYPEHGILGEELGVRETLDDFVWVIDPIDGTRAFLAGKPQFGTLIALTYRGQPVLGIIDQPILRERWVGQVGEDTTLNGKAISTRECPEVKQAVLSTTSPYYFSGANKIGYEVLRKQVGDVIFGGDCYAYGLLAAGFIDIVLESGLKPYDFCALVPIIDGAGGTMTDWQGEPLTLESDGTVLASGDNSLHKEALSLLQPAP